MYLNEIEVSEIMENSESQMLAQCPACGQRTLKSEAGCHECINADCGYGVCD